MKLLIDPGRSSLAIALLFWGGLCAASAAQSQGWIEATAIVRSLEPHQRFFEQVGGFEVRHRGAVSRALLSFWGLGEKASGIELLLAEPDSTRGFIRLVALSGVPQQREIRSAGQFFDSGGIMGLNVRVSDISKTFARAQAAGWRALSEPVWFSVEEFSVGEAVFMGPDGLAIGLIERQKPPLGPQWSLTDGTFSRPNNAFVITTGLSAARAFYQDGLGWQPFLEDLGPAAKPGMNLYGWPHNRVADVQRKVVWWHPQGGGEGSLAQIELRGVTGRNFARHAAPPNLGWVALRHVQDSGPPESSNQQVFVLPPYGCVSLSQQVDADGVRHEFLTESIQCQDRHDQRRQ